MLSFVLLVGAFILFMSPIFGLIYLAVAALVFTILWQSWPKLRSVITVEAQRVRQQVKEWFAKLTRSDTVEFDVSFRASYQLVYTKHGRNQKTLIDRENFVIGRSPQCDLVIPDPIVSSQHCCIVYQKHQKTYRLMDLNSKNGTFIGTKRLEPYTQEALLDGATITIAGRTYQFVQNG